MAAAFLNDYSTKLEVVSAGLNPTQFIDSLLITAMKECLIDLEDYVPKDAKSFDVLDFDMVYKCPDKPAPTTLEEYRILRDYIKNEAYLFFRNKIQSL